LQARDTFGTPISGTLLPPSLVCHTFGMAESALARVDRLIKEAEARPGVAETLRIYEAAARRIPVQVPFSRPATYSSSANTRP
jgi:hypothetical protein